MKKLLSILSLLLLGSTVTFAQVKIADGIANGTVKSAVSGQTVTLTATPADGYYLESIEAVKTVDASNAGRTRADIPVGGDYTLTKTSTSADRSQAATYTLTLPEGYGAYVTASFAARTAITASQIVLSAESLVYNGSDQKPTVSITGLTENADYTVSFNETSWKDAGTYTVTVTGIDTYKGTPSKTWTVTPKTVTAPTITLSETSYVYDGQEKKPTVTVKDGDAVIPATEYSVSYKDNVNVGTATVTITDVEGGNYTVSGSTTFAISSADGSLTPPAGISGLIYSGKAQALITAGSSTTGTVKYSLNGSTYSTDIPQGTDAKDYTVYYMVEGDANHSGIEAASFKVTIAPKTVTVTAEDKSKVYGADDPTLTAKVEGLIGTDEVTYTLSRAKGEDVGEYAITASGDAAQGNYSVTFVNNAKLTITVVDGTLTAPVAVSNLVYSGAAQALITAGSSTAGTMKYSLDGTTYSTDIPTGTDAKEYTVYYKVEADKNHNDVDAASLKVSIAPKTVSAPTITLSETSYVYDGQEKKPTVTVKDGDAVIPATEYSVSYKDNVNVGTATVTITDVEGGNYTVSGSTTFAISAADGSLTPPAGISGLVYSGKAQALITAGSSTTGTMKYSLDGTTYSTDIPQGTDAKEYTIYYKVEGDANHSSTDAASFKVSIVPKAVTVTAEDASKVYGADDPTLTATVAGTIGEDNITYTLSRAKGEDVGEYAITASGDAAQGNYAVTYSGAKLTITKADGSLTAPTAVSKLVYSGKAQALISAGSSTTGTVKYSLDGTTYSTDIPTGTDAKEYTVYYKVEADKNHNDVTAASLKVTIAPKAVTVTAEDKTKVEGEADPELTAKVEGLIGTDKVAYTLSRAKGETVGEYAITASGDAAQGNYAVTFVGAKLTITAKPKPSGDVNDDGVVNIADVVALSRAILAGSTDEKYDINDDGSVNAKDITALVAIIANL